MAGGEERVLRRRIKSVQSTKKITKAMELIAASRIVKAQQRVVAARPYSDQILHVLHNLSTGGAATVNPLLQPQPDDEVRTVEYVVARRRPRPVRRLQRRQHPHRGGRDAPRAGGGARRRPRHGRQEGAVVLPVPQVRDRRGDQRRHRPPTYEDARRVAAEVLPRFEAGEVQRVQLVYTEFLSAGSQRVVDRRFLPLDAEAMGSGRRRPETPRRPDRRLRVRA